MKYLYIITLTLVPVISWGHPGHGLEATTALAWTGLLAAVALLAIIAQRKSKKENDHA